MSKKIYQLHIALKWIKPPIWRRVQVPSDITLHDLHKIIQTTMNWMNSHLHIFIVGNTTYGPSQNTLPFSKSIGEKNYEKVKISGVLKKPKDKIYYEYDFGDSWMHEVKLEKNLEPKPNKQYPVCIKGERGAPPEDCGGIPGYYELVDIINDPDHPEHEEMKEFAGEDYDPEVCNIDYINELLQTKNYGCFFESE